MQSGRSEVTFTSHDGERTRHARVFDESHLALLQGPTGAEIASRLADVGEALGMGLVLLGHVNEDRYTVVALSRREPHYALEPGDIIPIGETYCREEITADLPFVLGDATLHERFASHPGFLKYGLRSYVGAPVVLPDGTLFGTLCGVDTSAVTPGLAGVERLVKASEELARLIHERLR